jgi:uncharacterized protein
MIKRHLQTQIEKSLQAFPVVGLLGPRQVGKTTLAKQIAQTLDRKVLYLDLERTSDLRLLDQAEMFFLDNSDKLIILDEIQRKPEIFPLMRAIIDIKRTNGRFLVLGSAGQALLQQTSESLAGRICYLDLNPLSISEIDSPETDYRKLWVRGGYPDSFLAQTEEMSLEWRHNLIKTYLERDIPAFKIRIAASMLQRFWEMLAHSHGQLFNGSKIAAGLGISGTTVRRYLDILQDTFMVRQLQPFYVNTKKRLIKSPKVYLRDSGILHALLGITDYDVLFSHPALGSSWEGWVIEQVISRIPRMWDAYFYRTQTGAEIDLVIQKTYPRPIIAIDIKFSLAPEPTKGFWQSLEDLRPDKAFVIYPGQRSYPLSKTVEVLPLSQIDKIWLQEQNSSGT